MKHIKKFESYEYENFTSRDMDMVEELWNDGMTDPYKIKREMEYLSMDEVDQIITTLKKVGKIK